MKLRTKLIAGFAVVLGLTILLGVFSLMKLAGVRATAVDLGENWLSSIQTLAEMRDSIAVMRRCEFRLILERNEEGRAEARRSLDAAHESFEKARAKYEPLISSPEEKALYESLAGAFDGLQKSDAEEARLAGQGNVAATTDFVLGPQQEMYEKTSTAIVTRHIAAIQCVSVGNIQNAPLEADKSIKIRGVGAPVAQSG